MAEEKHVVILINQGDIMLLLYVAKRLQIFSVPSTALPAVVLSSISVEPLFGGQRIWALVDCAFFIFNNIALSIIIQPCHCLRNKEKQRATQIWVNRSVLGEFLQMWKESGENRVISCVTVE